MNRTRYRGVDNRGKRQDQTTRPNKTQISPKTNFAFGSQLCNQRRPRFRQHDGVQPLRFLQVPQPLGRSFCRSVPSMVLPVFSLYKSGRGDKLSSELASPSDARAAAAGAAAGRFCAGLFLWGRGRLFAGCQILQQSRAFSFFLGAVLPSCH